MSLIFFVSCQKSNEPLNKDKIYDIRTSSGRRILCSKDHKLLTKIKRQDKFVFVPAEELHVKDRLCSTVENLNINKDDFEYLCGEILGIIERHIVIENNKYIVKIPLRYVKTCSFIKDHLSDIEYIFGESISINELFGFLWFELSKEAYNEFQNELPYYDDNYSLEFSLGFIDGFIAEYNKYTNTYCVRTDNTDFILFIEKIMLGLGEVNRAKELLCYPGIYMYFIKKKYYNLFNLANDEKMSPNKERELDVLWQNFKVASRTEKSPIAFFTTGFFVGVVYTLILAIIVSFIVGYSPLDDMHLNLTKPTVNVDEWIGELQQECNNQGYSNQKVDSIGGPATLAGCPTVKKGAKGNITRLIQKRLLSLGYKLPKWGADGGFGDETVEAVKLFQSDNGLTPDGIVGQNTWRKLLNL